MKNSLKKIDQSLLKRWGMRLFFQPMKSRNDTSEKKALHPFWVIVNKEVADHIKSWRFIILFIIILIACAGSLLTSLMHFGEAVKGNEEEGFFFLKLFTASESGLPSFMVFISFLGPLL